MNEVRQRPAAILWLVCIAFPWLIPFAGGPSVAVQPWLATAACASLLCATRQWRAPGFPVSLWIALACIATAARSLPSLDAWAVVGALVLVLALAGAVQGEGREEFMRAMAAGWLAAALVSSVFALLQYFGAAGTFSPLISHAPLGEAYGNLRQRNQLASLMAIGLAALLWFVRGGWTWPRAAVPLILLAAGGAASASRNGALQWLVLVALAVVWRGPARGRVRGLVATGVLVYAMAAIALPWLLSQAMGVEGPSVFSRFARNDGCAGRGVLWSNILHLIAQRPWTGWGWGELDYAHYMTLYSGARFCDILDNAHSLPLHLAVELGVPVAAAVCVTLLWALWRLAPWRETDPSRQLALSVLFALLLHSLLEYPLWYGQFQFALGLALGVLWPSRAQPASADGFRAKACPIGAGLALAVLGYAAWDYHRISQIYLAPEARSARYRVDPLPLIRDSRLFGVHVRFAELTITPLTRANAQWSYDSALELLHYSPEPRVIERVIESASLLGRDQLALAHLARYRAAFPKEHEEWARDRGLAAALAPLVVKD